MDTINIEGYGNLKVPADFRQWDEVRQQDLIKRAVASLGDGGVEEVVDTVTETIPATPLTPTTEQTEFVDGDVFTSNVDGQQYNVIDAGGSLILQTVTGVAPSFEIQEEFNNLVHRGDRDTTLRDTLTQPDVQKAMTEWDKLPQSKKDSLLSNSPNVAYIASAIDNLLPIPIIWALSTIGMGGKEAQIMHAIENNPDKADAGAMAGTIISLVGGPAAAAGLSRKAYNLWKANALQNAADLTTKNLKKIRSAAEELVSKIKKSGDKAPYAMKALKEAEYDIQQTTDVLRDWFIDLHDKGFDINTIRVNLKSRINGLPEGNVLKQLADADSDIIDTLLERLPAAGEPVEGWTNRTIQKMKYNLDKALLNKVPTAIEIGAALGGDAVANFTYSYNDWREQGFSEWESTMMGLRYVADRTPQDVLVEGIRVLFGPSLAIAVMQALGRVAFLSEDLDKDTGQVMPEVYDRKPVEGHADGGLIAPRLPRYRAGGMASGGEVAMRTKFNGSRRMNKGGMSFPNYDAMRVKFYTNGGSVNGKKYEDRAAGGKPGGSKLPNTLTDEELVFLGGQRDAGFLPNDEDVVKVLKDFNTIQFNKERPNTTVIEDVSGFVSNRGEKELVIPKADTPKALITAYEEVLHYLKASGLPYSSIFNKVEEETMAKAMAYANADYQLTNIGVRITQEAKDMLGKTWGAYLLHLSSNKMFLRLNKAMNLYDLTDDEVYKRRKQVYDWLPPSSAQIWKVTSGIFPNGKPPWSEFQGNTPTMERLSGYLRNLWETRPDSDPEVVYEPTTITKKLYDK